MIKNIALSMLAVGLLVMNQPAQAEVDAQKDAQSVASLSAQLKVMRQSLVDQMQALHDVAQAMTESSVENLFNVKSTEFPTVSVAEVVLDVVAGTDGLVTELDTLTDDLDKMNEKSAGN